MKSTVVSNGALLRERRHAPIAAFHSPAIPRAGSHSGAMTQRVPSRSGHCGPRTATPEVQQQTAATEQPTPQRNIIVAVDDSKDSQYACAWAIDNLYKAGDVFHIVHCVPDTVAQVVQAVPTGGHAIFTTRTDDAKLKAEVERATEQMSASFSEIFQTAGVPFELDILSESGAQYMNGVGDVICAKAEELQAAAVVVASHNRSALAEFFLGSICNFCVHHCKQPTMVLHNPGKLEAEAQKEGARHIVITVDDSQQSEAACEWACQHLYQPGDTFHILHVVPAMLARPVYAAGMDGVVYYIPPMGSELEDLQQASKREISKRFIHLMEKHDIPFELDVLSEFSHDPTLSVAKTICKTAEDLKAGCVVLSSHSKGPIVEFLLGSVTSYCTHHCQRPVVVLH